MASPRSGAWRPKSLPWTCLPSSHILRPTPPSSSSQASRGTTPGPRPKPDSWARPCWGGHIPPEWLPRMCCLEIPPGWAPNEGSRPVEPLCSLAPCPCPPASLPPAPLSPCAPASLPGIMAPASCQPPPTPAASSPAQTQVSASTQTGQGSLFPLLCQPHANLALPRQIQLRRKQGGSLVFTLCRNPVPGPSEFLQSSRDFTASQGPPHPGSAALT